MGDKLIRQADSQYLVSKVREIGKRAKLDKTKLLAAGLAVSKRDSSNILEGLDNIASDGSVSPIEKRQLEILCRQIESEFPIVISEAETYTNLEDWTSSYTAQVNSFKASYTVFHNQLLAITQYMQTSTTINRESLMSATKAYYSALEATDTILQKFRYGIDRIEIRYKVTQTQDKPLSNEITEVELPTLSSTDKYLWKKQTIYYTNGRTDISVDLAGTYGDDGEDGLSFTVVIESTNGDTFRPNQISTTLSCKVYYNNIDFTEEIDASKFHWKRKTGNSIEDERWNTSSKAIGKRSVTITSEDCIGRTVFDCEVDLPNL